MQADTPCGDSEIWFARAEQARRISWILSGEDAERARAYAEECEACAMQAILEPLAA
jgi:hypothetical protein